MEGQREPLATKDRAQASRGRNVRLYEEETAIRDAMTDLPALSVAALKAKLAALLDGCEYPELNDAILRDLTQMTNA